MEDARRRRSAIRKDVPAEVEEVKRDADGERRSESALHFTVQRLEIRLQPTHDAVIDAKEADFSSECARSTRGWSRRIRRPLSRKALTKKALAIDEQEGGRARTEWVRHAVDVQGARPAPERDDDVVPLLGRTIGALVARARLDALACQDLRLEHS